MALLLLKICGRNFVIAKDKDNKHRNFIVREFGKAFEENETFVLDQNNAFEIDDGKIKPMICTLKVIKLLKNHVKSFDKLRRKRHTKLTGYVQYVAYLSVISAVVI